MARGRAAGSERVALHVAAHLERGPESMRVLQRLGALGADAEAGAALRRAPRERLWGRYDSGAFVCDICNPITLSIMPATAALGTAVLFLPCTAQVLVETTRKQHLWSPGEKVCKGGRCGQEGELNCGAPKRTPLGQSGLKLAPGRRRHAPCAEGINHCVTHSLDNEREPVQSSHELVGDGFEHCLVHGALLLLAYVEVRSELWLHNEFHLGL
jgi:hypothetical protein